MKDEIDTIDDNELSETVEDIVAELSEALLYNDQDIDFLEVVFSLAVSLGYLRIGRLALECIIACSNKMSSFLEGTSSSETLNPQDCAVLLRFRKLLNDIGDYFAFDSIEAYKKLTELRVNRSYNFRNHDFNWLTSRMNKFKPVDLFLKNESEKRLLHITINSKDWISITTALHETLVGLLKSKKKYNYEDLYGFTPDPILIVKLTLPHGDVVTEKEPVIIEIDEESDHEVVEIRVAEEQKDESSEADDSKKRRRKSEAEESSKGSRSSKRFRTRGGGDQTLSVTDVNASEEFFEQVRSFLVLCDLKFDSILPAFAEEPVEAKDRYIYDFKVLLQSWDDDQAEVFLRKDSFSTKKDLGQPVMQLLDFAALGNSEAMKAPSDASTFGAEEFIYNVNKVSLHLQEVRTELVYFLLKARANQLPSILFESWPDTMVKNLKQIIESCEPLIFSQTKEAMFNVVSNSELVVWANIAEAIFEIFVNEYLSAEKMLRSREGKSTRLARKELEINNGAMKVRFQRWKGVYHDLISMYNGPFESITLMMLRHEWVSIFSGVVYGDVPEDNIKAFENFQNQLKEYDGKFEIQFTNFSNIPRLSIEGAHTQISKFRAAAIFAKAFNITDNKEVEFIRDEDDNQLMYGTEKVENREVEDFDRIQILESILMPEEQTVKMPEQDAIAQFLSTASHEFRLRLWYLLLDAYNANGECGKSFDGYLRILKSSIEEFTNSSNDNEHERSIALLCSLNMCSDIEKSLLVIALENQELLDGLSEDRKRGMLEVTIKLLRVLHIYISYEDAIINNIIQAPSHPSWEKTTRQIKELIVRSWCLFYLFYRSCLRPEKRTPEVLNDILSIVHEEIGTRGYCGMAEGVFLELCLSEMSNFNWEGSQTDMLQCLHCRYGLTLGSEEFSPYDHHTTPGELDRKSALHLCKFIMGMVLRKKNLSQSILRVDVKACLDQFYEALGNPDLKVPAIGQNASILDKYLTSSYITLPFLYDCLRGGMFLSFLSSSNEIIKVGHGGLYYTLGQAQLSLFRVRKRSPGKTEDVEKAIKFFKYDLMCNTNRFESWLGLAQSYDALAEDDLTWNADKLNSASDARNLPATHQRHSMLACCMAVNVYLQRRNHKEETDGDVENLPNYGQLVSTLWTFFARILYNSCRTPMRMRAFQNESKDRYYCGADGVYRKKPGSATSEMFILKIIDTCLKIAVSENKKDYFNYYLRANVLHKLESEHKLVIRNLIRAVELVPERTGSGGSHNDIILEPHYKLVSILYKYAMSKYISAEVGLKLLEKTPYCEISSQVRSELGTPQIFSEHEARFYASCVLTLLRIKTVDKRKWYHRPYFRLAKIYDEIYDDKLRAKEEMSIFFAIKSTVKSPLHIWKPDLERPGQHFEFVYQYMVYFTDLLRYTKDTSGLAIMARKLRRFQSGISHHQDAWEHICNAATVTVKEILSIEPKYSDQVIAALVFEQFDVLSNELVKEMEAIGQNELPPIYNALHYATEFRRLNNGFGSTAALDDLYVSIYLMIYSDFAKNRPIPITSSSPQHHLLTEPTSSTPFTPKPSNKIAISNLLSPEPNSKDATPNNNAPTATTTTPPQQQQQQHKVRVTRREIMTRASALVKAIVAKLPTTDSSKLEIRNDFSLPNNASTIHDNTVPPKGPSNPGSPSVSTGDNTPVFTPPEK